MRPLIDRIDETHITNQGLLVKIVKYESTRSCDIQFEDGYIIKNRSYQCVKKGKIKHPFHPWTFGIGFMGEGLFNYKNNSLGYDKWTKMLKRVVKTKDYPTYKDVTVCEEWHNFQNFAKWFEKNYNPKIMKGWHLDKDILSGEDKIYSPETCCFVPPEINFHLRGNISNKKGGLPKGVIKIGNKYVSRCNIKGKLTSLGRFNHIEEALQAYKKRKRKRV